MKAKEYLEGIRKLDTYINSLIAEYETMKALAVKITPEYEGERVQNSGNQDKLGSAVVKLVEYQERINKNIDKYVNMRDNILQVINMLENADHITILRKRYYEYKSWEQIACEMGYTWRWVLILHGRALNCMDNILNVEKK